MLDDVARALAMRAPVAASIEQLQAYMDRGERAIRIAGKLTYTSGLVIPHHVSLFGAGGRYNRGGDTIEGDALVGSVAGAALDLAFGSRIFGLAIANTNSGGIAIRDQGGQNWIQDSEIIFTGTGILQQNSGGGSGYSETRIERNRLTGGHNNSSPVLTSLGIDNQDHTDGEINGNVIRYANIGMRDNLGSTFVRANHWYCGSPSNTGTCDFQTTSGCPGQIGLESNYFEGHVAEMVVFQHYGFVDKVIGNDFGAPGGAETTAFFHWDNTTLGYGALNEFQCFDNTFHGVGGSVAVGIKNTSVTNAATADVRDNMFKNVTVESQLRTRGRGHATGSGDGSATSFTIAHGLFSAERSVWAQVMAASSGAANISHVTTDGTHITVHYSTAPANGASLAWDWQARTY